MQAIGGFFLGLVMTYLVVVFALLWYVGITGIADSHGLMVINIVFRIGPFFGIVGGAICAFVLSRWLNRRRTRKMHSS